jgi:hypothetical protein
LLCVSKKTNTMNMKHLKSFNENVYGISLKSLPEIVYNSMTYEFNIEFTEIKDCLTKIKNWIKKNLDKLETGLSSYFLSNEGNDFKDVCSILGCDTSDIIDYINTSIDEIIGY